MTDESAETIPIECGECGQYRNGWSAMVTHLAMKHKNYTAAEQREYAEHWLHDAWRNADQFALEHIADHRSKCCDCSRHKKGE